MTAVPTGQNPSGDNSEASASRKRPNPVSSEEEAEKLAARREANRIHAFKSRQRSKALLQELQRTVELLTGEKSELERENAVLRAQVDVLQQQNLALTQSQRMLLIRAGQPGTFGATPGAPPPLATPSPGHPGPPPAAMGMPTAATTGVPPMGAYGAPAMMPPTGSYHPSPAAPQPVAKADQPEQQAHHDQHHHHPATAAAQTGQQPAPVAPAVPQQQEHAPHATMEVPEQPKHAEQHHGVDPTAAVAMQGQAVMQQQIALFQQQQALQQQQFQQFTQNLAAQPAPQQQMPSQDPNGNADPQAPTAEKTE